MKKIGAILLVIAMLACLCACGDSGEQQTTQKTTTATAAGETTTSATVGATTETATADTTVTTTTTTGTSTTGIGSTPTASSSATTQTSATTATTTTPPTQPPKNPGNVPKSIKILSVGNSFSVDAMQNHLYQMFEAAGCTDIRLGILYVGGASIDTHYENVRRDSAKYDYYENVNGEWVITPNYKASDAFALTDWDIVTLQQVSGHSGRGISLENLQPLINLIRPQIGDAKLYWHMTWAYQQDSPHSDFANYNKDQMRMYKGIVRVISDNILKNSSFVGYFPCGTSIQNLRTSSLGDTLTEDGHHLTASYGDYTAALTWFCYLTGADAETMTYRPASIAGHFGEIAESVNNAIKTPLAVTECT